MAIETKVDKLLSQGNDYYDSRKYDEAIRCFDKVIKKYSSSTQIVDDYKVALFNKGLALYNLGKYGEAIRCYDKILEKESNYVYVWNSKGVALNGLKKYDEAIKCYQKAIEIDPNYSFAWTNQGNVFSNLGKYDEAIKFYDIAIEKDPNNKWAWHNKGLAFHILGKDNIAIECYNKAISEDPNYVEVWCNKGTALMIIGNYSEAEICFDEVVKINPINIDALNGLRYIYSEIKQEYYKALQLSQTLLKLKPSLEAKVNLAENLIEVGRFEDGRKYALQALTETQDVLIKCVTRLLILSSYILEDDESNSRMEYAKFFEFYMNVNMDFKIEETQWSLRGLINVISKSGNNIQKKFLLLTLIDIIQGKIDKQKLSFFSVN